ncbi:EVE domain-containing protein [Angustibacter luteus]|uniref:UPF0310 protein ACFQDO_12765 n=1 Tax=Angustibacter luteus TaxID=658456 RepID=A0ABW1JFP7_9ACTN
MRRYWVNTVSRDHVLIGVEGGFTQADHGRSTRLHRLSRGDVLVFYSPRTAMGSGDPVQCFTAIGVVADDEPYQVEMSETFHPWRRRLDVLPSHEAAAKPLVEQLSFVADPQRWGLPFRRGLFEVPAADLAAIAHAMGAELP